jgi:hypothetical protein
MDGIVWLIIIAVVSNIIKKSRKKSGAAPRTAKKSGAQSAFERFEQWAERMDKMGESQEGPVQPAAPAAQPTVRAVDRKAELKAKYGAKLHHGEGGLHEESTEGISRPLAPSAELTAGRAAGSIVFHSDEGQDVCDPTLLHGESGLEMPASPVFPTHAEDEPFLSAGDLVRGFVVSEILARPVSSRMARMR